MKYLLKVMDGAPRASFSEITAARHFGIPVVQLTRGQIEYGRRLNFKRVFSAGGDEGENAREPIKEVSTLEKEKPEDPRKGNKKYPRLGSSTSNLGKDGLKCYREGFKYF